MLNEYKEIKCSINDKECYEMSNCDDCDIPQKERDFEIREIESSYQFNFTAKFDGNVFKRNGRNTVLKAEISNIDILKKYMRVTSESAPYDRTKYLWDIAKHYPEWEKTKEFLKIEGNPDKIIYEHEKPLFVFYGNEIYIIAPNIEESNV